MPKFTKMKSFFTRFFKQKQPPLTSKIFASNDRIWLERQVEDALRKRALGLD